MSFLGSRRVTSYLVILGASFALFGSIILLVVEQVTGPSLAFFASALLFFVFAAVGGRHRAWQALRGGPFRRRAALVLYCALGAIIAFFVNLHGQRVNRQWDLTEEGWFTPSKATLHWLSRLQRPVEVIVFAKHRSSLWEMTGALLDRLRRESPLLRYELIDPDLDPHKAQEHRVRRPGVALFRGGTTTFRLPADSESSYANAFRRLAEHRPLRAYILFGHGERDPAGTDRVGMRAAVDALVAQNTEVRRLSLVSAAQVPADCDLLIVADPRKDFEAGEIAALRAYVQTGAGRLVALVEQVDLPRFKAFLKEATGLAVPKTILIDVEDHARNRPTSLFVRRFGSHAITKGLGPVNLVGASCVLGEDGPKRSVTALGTTSKRSWAESTLGTAHFDPKQDLPGPLAVGAVVEAYVERRSSPPSSSSSPKPASSSPKPTQRRKLRVVVVGDADFVSNAYLERLSNRELWLAACDWAGRDQNKIYLLPRGLRAKEIFMSRRQFRVVFFLAVFGMPFLPLVLAFHVYWMRR